MSLFIIYFANMVLQLEIGHLFDNDLNVMIYDGRRAGASGMETGVQRTTHTSR